MGYRGIASGLQKALTQMRPMFEMMDNDQLMALLQDQKKLNTLMALAGDADLMALLLDPAKVAALKELAGNEDFMALLGDSDAVSMLMEFAPHMGKLQAIMTEKGWTFEYLIAMLESSGSFGGSTVPPVTDTTDTPTSIPDDNEETTPASSPTGSTNPDETGDESEGEIEPTESTEPTPTDDAQQGAETEPAAETTDAQEGGADVQLMSSSSSSGFGDFDLGDFGSLEDMMENMPAAPGEDAPALEQFQYMFNMLNFLNKCLGMISGILTEMGDQLILAGMEMADSMEGLTDFDLDAVTELQEGMVLLADNYGEFNEGLGLYLEGVAAVAEGLGTYASGMYALNSETQAIPDMVDALLGTGDEEEEESGPVSFLSEENEDTAAVQFVLSTEGIAAPEAEEEPAPPAEEEQGFFGDLWDKVVNLF